MLRLITILSLIFFYSPHLISNETGEVTGYKLPRYVSLKSNESNLRIGPSKNYPIILKFTSQNYPVEIIDEYNNWRKIIDIDNNEGWLHKNLLKGKRFAIIKPYDVNEINVKLYVP